MVYLPLNSIVAETELSSPVPVEHAYDYANSLLKRFHANERLKHILILRKGVVQEIVEEFVPLSIYSSLVYSSQGCLLKFFPGSKQSFDGQIVDLKGDVIETIEVTMAVDGYKRVLQGESLIKFGHSPIYQTPEYRGNARERVLYESEAEMVSIEEVIESHICQILRAYEKKAKHIQKYPDTTLLIATDLGLLLENERQEIISSVNLKSSEFPKVILVDITTKKIWQMY